MELLTLLFVILLLTYFLIQPLDNYVLMNKHQYAEHIMNKYLSRMRVEGRLSISDENNIKTELNGIGCVIDSDSTTYVTARAMESKGNARILRSNDVDASELSLSISCRPEPQPFKPTALIKGVAPSGIRIKVGGKELSERVIP